MAKAKKQLSFKDINTALNKINPEGSIMSESVNGKIDEYISIGNYALNAQVSGSIFKGIPSGRITMVAGQSGCLIGDEIVDVYIMKSKSNRKIQNEIIEELKNEFNKRRENI